jgi:ubiquinone/menaquinone biosynthesis C-methylase UbiE
MTEHLVSAERFNGLADGYDRNRPAPPKAIIDVLCRYAAVPSPRLVADIGCGTGLFTRQWIGRAEAVVGIEPSRDMRRRAAEATAGLPGGDTVRYLDGQAADTGLPAASVDIATCSQSLHWMEPESTLAEMARILRPGGVFAAVDVDMAPAFGGPAEEALLAMRRQTRHLEETLRPTTVRRWDKAGHLARLEASGRFRFTREITAHMVEPGTGPRLVGLALSMGGVAALLAHGVSEEDCGLADLRREAAAMGETPVPFHWSYRVRLGVTG